MVVLSWDQFWMELGQTFQAKAQTANRPNKNRNCDDEKCSLVDGFLVLAGWMHTPRQSDESVCETNYIFLGVHKTVVGLGTPTPCASLRPMHYVQDVYIFYYPF